MKKIVLVFILVSFGIFSCACTRESQHELEFMTWGSKSEMDIIKPIVEEYNNTHEIKVKLVHVPQNYFQKLHLLFASNLAPDIIFINNLYLKIYQKADLLEDLTLIIQKDDYFENALATLSSEGKIYAVPRDVSSMVVFYNKNKFAEANINIKDFWTTNEFYKTAKKLKETNSYGFCTEMEPGYWENFVSVENKPLIFNNKVTIEEETSINALQRLADSINKENIGVNKEQLAISPCAQLFLNQKAPMFISGRWSVPKLNAQAEFEYGILPFPKGNSKYYIPINASGWAISKKSKNKEAAIDFVKYISSDENIEKITASGLITPAKKKAASSKNFKNGKVFIDIIEKSTPNQVPADYNVIIDKLTVMGKSVLGGYKTAKEALKN